MITEVSIHLLKKFIFFGILSILLIYVWLYWVFVAAWALLYLWRAGTGAPRCSGFSCCRAWALGTQASSVAAPGLPSTGCGTRASLPHGMWELPGSGFESESLALAGGFFTTEPPGKPRNSSWRPTVLHYTDLEAGHTKLKQGMDSALVTLWWGEKTCLRRQGVCITCQGCILGKMQLTVQRLIMGNYFHKNCKKSRHMLRALPLNTLLSINTDLKHILKTLKRHYVNTEGKIKGHVQSFAP